MSTENLKNCEMGMSVEITTISIMLREISSWLSAISFWVFCLFAPSTRFIIWSRKVLPGSLLTLAFPSPERTVVPPRSESLSPPVSFTCGSDSPVIIDSLTTSAPSTTWQSMGTVSPSLSATMSPFLSSLLFVVTGEPEPVIFIASVSERRPFRDSAFAFPWASARDSDKLANQSVKKRMSVISR